MESLWRTLPNEIVDEIFEQLTDTSAYLTLRLLNSKYHAHFTTVLKRRHTWIYVYPSPTALTRLEDICNSGTTLVDEVTTIALVMPPEYHWSRRYVGREGADNELQKLNNCRWPHMITSSHAPEGKPSTLPEIIRDENTPFFRAFVPLIRSLSNLPKVSKLALAEPATRLRPCHPGFNAVSRDFVYSWADKCGDLSDVYDPNSRNDMSIARHVVRWTDAEVFLGLLKAMANRIFEIDFGNLMDINVRDLRANVREGNDGQSPRDSFHFSTLLQEAAVSVKHLTFGTGAGPAILELESTFAVGLHHTYYPNFIRHTLEPFLERHIDTLRALHLKNVHFEDGWVDPFTPMTATQVMRRIKDTANLRELKYLLKFMVRNYHLHDQHGSCYGLFPASEARNYGIGKDGEGYFDFGQCFWEISDIPESEGLPASSIANDHEVL